LPLLPIA